MVHLCSTVLNIDESLELTDFGWTLNTDDSTLRPDPCMRELPEDVNVTCSCKSCDTKRRCAKICLLHIILCL